MLFSKKKNVAGKMNRQVDAMGAKPRREQEANETADMMICIGRNADGGRIVLARSSAGDHPVRFLEIGPCRPKRRREVAAGVVFGGGDQAGVDATVGATGTVAVTGGSGPETVTVFIDTRSRKEMIVAVEIGGRKVQARAFTTNAVASRPGPTRTDIEIAGGIAGAIERVEIALAPRLERPMKAPVKIETLEPA